MDGRCSQGSHINFNDHLRWDVFSRKLDKPVFFELVACWMLRELASKGCAVEFDSTVTRTGTLS